MLRRKFTTRRCLCLQALVENIGLSKDQMILIHGDAGGIGSIAIQLAKYVGADVP